MSEFSDMSDNELLRVQTERPEEAADRDRCGIMQDSGRLAELISRYMKTVFACARKYASAADYEELVSAGMEGLLSAVQNYSSEKGDFAAFAGVCINNSLRNTVKRSIRRNSRIAGEEELPEIPDNRPTPEEAFIDKENSEAMLRVMKSALTTLELQCIEGAAMGLSYAEIAKSIGVDTKTVDNGLVRARTKLRRRLMDEDF